MIDSTSRRGVLIGGLAATVIASSPTLAQAAPRFRIALTGDYEHLAKNAAPWTSLGDDVEVVSFNEPLTSTAATVQALRDFDAVVLMRERTPMPREVIENLPRLKVIVFSGLMNATMDHNAAAARNIVVAQALGMSSEDEDGPAAGQGGGGPAELAFALLLACSWHIPQADALIRSGGWAMQPQIPLKIPLAGKVLGIPGYGGIGERMGRYAQSLGMKVLGFSRSLTEEAAAAANITRAPDLDTVMRESDAISIHLPLTAQTVGMIGPSQIGMMKQGSILINTARAHIVDRTALLEALQSRKIAMGGFDVHYDEPLPPTDPMAQLPNVVMTPHIGYISESGLVSRYKALFQVLADFRAGNVKPYTPSARDMAS